MAIMDFSLDEQGYIEKAGDDYTDERLARIINKFREDTIEPLITEADIKEYRTGFERKRSSSKRNRRFLATGIAACVGLWIFLGHSSAYYFHEKPDKIFYRKLEGQIMEKEYWLYPERVSWGIARLGEEYRQIRDNIGSAGSPKLADIALTKIPLREAAYGLDANGRYAKAVLEVD